MKYVGERRYSDPEKAARRIIEHARAFDPIQDGRIYIEKINRPMIDEDKATPAKCRAGLKRAIGRGLDRVSREWDVRENDASRQRPVRLN